MPLFGPPNIEKLQEKGDVRSLLKALQHGDSKVRGRAAKALGEVQDARALEPLLVRLRDGSLDVRRSAALALGRLGDKRAVDPLAAALEDTALEGEAREALGRLGASAVIAQHRRREQTREQRSVKDARALQALTPESVTPLNALPQHVSGLVGYGLVEAAVEGGTSGYQLTADGLLYVDGMLGGPRDCPEHPDASDDLGAVSRGRMISLKADELVALATISLGERFTNHVVGCANEMELEEWIKSALMTLAGSMAHGVRHCHGVGWTPAKPLADVELTGDAKGAYERQLSASLSEVRRHEDSRRLTQAASDSWAYGSVPTVEPSRQEREVQAVLVLARSSLENAQTLIQQIVAQQRSNGHPISADFTAGVRTAGDSLDDIAYVYATLSEEFSDLGEHDLIDRTVEFPFQASDGNSGKYFVVFDRAL